MRVRVLRRFEHDGRVYDPGLYPMTAKLARDADELVRAGWVIVFFGEGGDVPRSERLTRRNQTSRHGTVKALCWNSVLLSLFS